MREYVRLTLYGVLVMMLSAIIAFADTHWANVNGSNIPPYTSYATGAHQIQEAIDAAMAGDTVRVAAGLYESDTTITLADSLNLIGAGMDSTTVRYLKPNHPTNRDLLVIMGNDFVSDIEFDGNDVSDGDGIQLRSTKQWSEITSCRIVDCDADAIDAGWAALEVHDCEFYVGYSQDGISLSPYQLKSIHHNTFTGWRYSKFIYVWSECDIHNNVFNLEGGSDTDLSKGISLQYGYGPMKIHNNLFLDGYEAIFMRDFGDVRVYNNTIIGTTSDRGPVPFACVSSNREGWVFNNIFLDCAWPNYANGAYDYPPSTVHFNYNVIWPPKDVLFIDTEHYLILDSGSVLFFDPMLSSDTNYYLQAGSPCIDAGDPSLLDVDSSRSDIGWTGSPGGVTYLFPEEPPRKPDTLLGELNTDTVNLSWPRNSEADLAGYRLYRETYSGFAPDEANLLSSSGSGDTTYSDSILGIFSNLYYVVAAVDTAGLESSPSNEVVVLSTGILGDRDAGGELPQTPYILGNYPNPFNSATTIEYFVPDIGARPTLVQLNIYDVLGRKVATIVDERQYPGYHQVSWDGRTDADVSAGSGVYFAKLTLWGYEFASSVKLVLQK
jgi:hypothetical protein